MKISSSNFSEEKFSKYQEILKNFNLSDYSSYIEKTEYIQNLDQFKDLISLLLKTTSNNASISYRYVEDKYFVIVFYINKNIYIISDEFFEDKNIITKIITKLATSKKNHKYFIWNFRHFLFPILNQLSPEQKTSISDNFFDVQIMDHLVNLEKNPSLSSKFPEDENDKKIKIFIEKVHKDESFYYYIPRHIITNVLVKEAVVISMMGQAFGYVITKLEQVELLKRLQKFSVILCDIEKNNFLHYDYDKIMQLDISNSFHKRLLDYVIFSNKSPIKLEYKFLNSVTGRLSFNNKIQLNMMAIPKSEVRETFIPENDIFVSIDMSGAEVFYCIKTYSDFLDDLEINNNFDIYSEIMSRLDGTYKRSTIKQILISMLYGASNFKEDELSAVLEIKEKLPQLSIELPKKFSTFIQTKKEELFK